MQCPAHAAPGRPLLCKPSLTCPPQDKLLLETYFQTRAICENTNLEVTFTSYLSMHINTFVPVSFMHVYIFAMFQRGSIPSSLIWRWVRQVSEELAKRSTASMEIEDGLGLELICSFFLDQLFISSSKVTFGMSLLSAVSIVGN
eukprot:1379898-Amorphochlora_amoeboformis.AAC.2